MPFNYKRVESQIVEHVDQVFEHEETHDERYLRSLRWPTAFFLLFAVLACELSTLNKQPISLPIGAELNKLVPSFTREQKIFRADARYASDHKTEASISATKAYWFGLMPRGEGFLDIPDYKSYVLPPPMHFKGLPGMEVYSIAVYHELHCLMHIAFFMDKLIMKIRNKDFTMDEGEIGHNDHCFNYLRNAVMCCGDTTLEGQSQAKMFEHVAGTDGTGAVHVCRNFDEIFAWAERRNITDGKETA
ncbi:hypothetical protein GQ44DRAFT_740603 [Phaeosphaeriaceae sp. PMI808]|nr:hypothetical protein GQ44DRAFT_740603 [Phaeosphaeriaceae sp. PMI808]